jgi:hypothetical protein
MNVPEALQWGHLPFSHHFSPPALHTYSGDNLTIRLESLHWDVLSLKANSKEKQEHPWLQTLRNLELSASAILSISRIRPCWAFLYEPIHVEFLTDDESRTNTSKRAYLQNMNCPKQHENDPCHSFQLMQALKRTPQWRNRRDTWCSR